MVSDHDVVQGAPVPTSVAPPGLPAEIDIAAIETLDGTAFYFAVGTVSVLGAITATPRHVVAWDGSGYSLVFKGGEAELPIGARIDALAVDRGAIIISLDITVQIRGLMAADEDLLRFEDGTATYGPNVGVRRIGA